MEKGAIDAKAAHNFFNHVQEVWIAKELQQRAESGKPVQGPVTKCLIKLPEGKPPIVLFNKEATFMVVGRHSPGRTFEKGQEMYIPDMMEILYALPPEVDGKPVPFVFIKLIDNQWHIFFDFSPQWKDKPSFQDYRDWRLGRLIAESFNQALAEEVVKAYTDQSLLEKIGLWMAPSLLPYPMSDILDKLSKGNDSEAIRILVQYSSKAFLEKISQKWFDIDPYKMRKDVLSEALDSHFQKKFHSSIYVLVPQIEGIITDWLTTKPGIDVPWREESKMKKFFADISSVSKESHVWKKTAESMEAFIISGPVLKTFKEWKEKIDPSFVNRHVVSHGRYEKELFSEENSIKLVLLLDSIYHLIKSKL